MYFRQKWIKNKDKILDGDQMNVLKRCFMILKTIF